MYFTIFINRSFKQTKKENIIDMNVVENEIVKELNWKEKIIVKVFNKTFKKVADLVRINIVNRLIN